MKYHADVEITDADGGSWNDDFDFEAENSDTAINEAVDRAGSWFQPHYRDGKEIPKRERAAKFSIALNEVDGDWSAQIDANNVHYSPDDISVY